MIDRQAAELLGWLPEDVDRCSLRDYALAIHGARERQRLAWQHTAFLAAAVHNWGGMRGPGFVPKRADELYPEIFGKPSRGRQMSKAEIVSVLSAGSKKVKPKTSPPDAGH